MTESKSINWWEDQVKKLMEGETHQEAFFRALLTLTELGDVAKYITHDPVLNPKARPHGSKEDEILAFGQLLIQCLSLTVARGVSSEAALNAGLKNWQEHDWQKKLAENEGRITGSVAVRGTVEGQAYVVSKENPLESFTGGVLVTEFLRASQSQIMQRGNLLAIVTDNGGIMSHPAILAREYNIVAIVGTGNATGRIPHGSRIIVDAQDQGKVILMEE